MRTSEMSSRNNLIINNFQKNATETLKQMRNVKEFSDVTLISEDQIMFQAHKVVLASTSPFFRKLINSSNHPVIGLRGVNSQFLASMLEVIYDGETKVNKDDVSSFIRFLEYYQVYEQDIHETKYEENHTKSSKHTNICNFWNKGFCKEKNTCMYEHPKDDCYTHIKHGKCSDTSCRNRHRDVCKYWEKGWCKRKDQCTYLHFHLSDIYEIRRAKSRSSYKRNYINRSSARRRYESESRSRSESESSSISESESSIVSGIESRDRSESEPRDRSESELRSRIESERESRDNNQSSRTHCNHSSESDCGRCFNYGLLDLEESS